MKAIILCGGLGTRLSKVLNNVPKAMAPINKTPFLSLLIKYLSKYKINEIILAVGYKHQVIKNFYGDSFKDVKISYSYEEKALGTGGALNNAFDLISDDKALILNGDTFFNINLNRFLQLDSPKKDVLVATKKINGSSRYNFLKSDKNSNLVTYFEKGKISSGYINGGIMILKKNIFKNTKKNTSFDLEDFIFSKKTNLFISMFKSKGYFVDIGTPEDFLMSQDKLKKFL